MPYCPNCGRYVSLGDTSCPECDCSLTDGSDDEPGPQHSGTERTQRAGSKRDEAGSGRDGHESRRRERPRQTGRNADAQTGKTRRTALAWAGGALGLTVLGTWALQLLDGEGPKDAIEAWRSAWTSGDDEAYREFLHTDSPLRTAETGGQQTRLSTADESLQYTNETREVLERTDTEATVRDVYLLTDPGFQNPRRGTDVIDLRTEDGDWRIWDYRVEQLEEATDCRQNITITGIGSLECG